jgi:hypothetical protein
MGNPNPPFGRKRKAQPWGEMATPLSQEILAMSIHGRIFFADVNELEFSPPTTICLRRENIL